MVTVKFELYVFQFGFIKNGIAIIKIDLLMANYIEKCDTSALSMSFHVCIIALWNLFLVCHKNWITSDLRVQEINTLLIEDRLWTYIFRCRYSAMIDNFFFNFLHTTLQIVHSSVCTYKTFLWCLQCMVIALYFFRN